MEVYRMEKRMETTVLFGGYIGDYIGLRVEGMHQKHDSLRIFLLQ